MFRYRLTMRGGNHVIDDVSVQQVMNSQQQQQQAAEITTTTTNLTDCFKSFTQQERVSCTRLQSTCCYSNKYKL